MKRISVVMMLCVACSSNVERTGETGQSVTVCPSATVEGIDVSYFQGNIDFGKVYASGRRFAFIRVSDGSFQDPKFGTYWWQAKSAGLLVGPYHFFRPGQNATTQANQFLNTIPTLGAGDLPAVLDVEVTDGQSSTTIRNGINTWISIVANATGKKPLVYTSPGLWSSAYDSGGLASRADLWVANWGVNCPSTASSWGDWRFWQYSDNGGVSGISGAVDLDRFHGTLSDLESYAGLNPSFDPDLDDTDFTVGSNADGRLEIFASGGEVFHRWQTQPNGGWGDWASRGGSISGAPVVASNWDGRLEVFARGQDGSLWHAWQHAPNSGWSDWYSLGGSITSDRVAVGRNADGHLEVFARGSDSAVWHTWQSNGGWTQWQSMGGVITSGVAVGSNADGRLEVFARGQDGAVWHDWQVSPNGGWTNAWHRLGGYVDGDVVVGTNADGRLEVFGSASSVVHAWQMGDGSWSGFASLGGQAKSLAIASNSDGRMELFARGSDDALWHVWQNAPNSAWSQWAKLGGILTNGPCVGKNADGRLEVFTGGTDGAVWHVWQTSQGWSGFSSLGGH